MSKIPKLTPIESSMFSHQYYDPNTRTLTVQYKNGGVYQHDDVPADKHDAFVGNKSPGKFFNDKIRNNFPGKKVIE